MTVLIFGPSGSGKTYVAKALQARGIKAFDADQIEGLSAWYDQDGRKVAAPASAEEAKAGNYAFLWSRKFLTKFLKSFSGDSPADSSDVYIFGGSGNIFNLLHLFNRVYFLKIEPDLQRQRLRSPSRPTPNMDMDENGLIVWGAWFEEQAQKHKIPFLDASLTPQQIFELISQKDPK
ncbi:MAG TPA: hypothetical protein VN824_04785 [Puia sp.]|nr:hypothetical protein [Puia sp.]